MHSFFWLCFSSPCPYLSLPKACVPGWSRVLFRARLVQAAVFPTTAPQPACPVFLWLFATKLPLKTHPPCCGGVLGVHTPWVLLLICTGTLGVFVAHWDLTVRVLCCCSCNLALEAAFWGINPLCSAVTDAMGAEGTGPARLALLLRGDLWFGLTVVFPPDSLLFCTWSLHASDSRFLWPWQREK